MNKHFTTLCSRTVDPIANRFKLGFKCVDTVIADAFDVEDFDPALTLLNPERALSTRALAWNELRVGVRQ